MDKIILNNMQFYGYHGVDDHEKENGGQFEIDLELYLDMEKAVNTDELANTIDYTKVYEKVKKMVESEKYSLIEALAGKIIKRLLIDFKISRAKIRLRKQYVPIEGVFDNVEVELERKREKLN